MVLTLDEAIKNAEEVASEWRDIDMGELDRLYCGDTECIEMHKSRCIECAEEFEQLSEWLKELKQLREQVRWIPCSERLPKENEYVGDVCKYYLIQDEYGDMYIAHLSSVGWIPINSLKAISDEVVAWKPSPEPYRAESGGNNEI